MRSSLIVLAVVLATLRLLEASLAHRTRRGSIVPVWRRRRAGGVSVSELSLKEGPAFRGKCAEGGRKQEGRNADAGGDRESSRFAEWRYYGFSNHPSEADASVAEDPGIVASSPAVGSVVTILPDGCVTTVVNGRVYRQCGSVWYQRQYTGSSDTWVVVRAP
jgi:hypothetical protein